jgi:hypothetical protein
MGPLKSVPLGGSPGGCPLDGPAEGPLERVAWRGAAERVPRRRSLEGFDWSGTLMRVLR